MAEDGENAYSEMFGLLLFFLNNTERHMSNYLCSRKGVIYI